MFTAQAPPAGAEVEEPPLDVWPSLLASGTNIWQDMPSHIFLGDSNHTNTKVIHVLSQLCV